MTDVWRVRMRYSPNDEDITTEAWEKDEVGFWYGASSAEELTAFTGREQGGVRRIAAELTALPSQVALGWPGGVTPGHVHTIFRFLNIGPDDWVLVYLADRQELGLGQVYGDLQTDQDLERYGEKFKFKTVRNKKTFPISRLPDAYRLISGQGRQQTIHRFQEMEKHVQLLAESHSCEDVIRAISDWSAAKLLDFMSSGEWEAFCFAYLVMEEGLIPTGVSAGGTLRDLDIVGRRREDGTRIIGQCKKFNNETKVEEAFLAACEPTTHAFYFAYGGCSGTALRSYKVFTRDDALVWLQTRNGIMFRRFFIGEPPGPSIAVVG